MKSRTYCGVWYPNEDPSHLFALQKLKACGYPFLAIDHTRDMYTLNDECEREKLGTLKKEHTHIVIQFNNPRSYDSVLKELQVKPNYLQVCRDTKSYMLYMLHDGMEDKVQYDYSECYGSLTGQLLKYLNQETESSRVLGLLSLLDSMPKPCSYRMFLTACCQNDLYSEFRRLGIGVSKLLEEHNGIGFSVVE